MGLWNRIVQKMSKQTFKMVQERGNGFYAWNGRLYQTAIIIRHKDRDCKCFFAFFQNFSLISDKKTSHLSIIF